MVCEVEKMRNFQYFNVANFLRTSSMPQAKICRREIASAYVYFQLLYLSNGLTLVP